MYTRHENVPNRVLVDADEYMPNALAEIDGVAGEEGLPPAVRLEVARQWRHLDVGLRAKHDGIAKDAVLEVIVTGDKTKWKVAAAPQPEGYPPVASPEFSRKVTPIARELYKRARGYLPA